MFELGERIYSNVSGKTYVITWASETITMAEVGFASTDADGDVFFIKRLLNMKYPLETSAGSPAMKAKRREICDNHFKNYQQLYLKIQRGCGDGACVPIIDYFREGAFYYTVYRKINASSLSVEEISKLNENDKYKLLLRLVQGLMPMHALGIIHGDLKPENILVQAKDGDWKIKLIDMNDCYLAGNPDNPGSVVGTPDYYSPELFKYNTYEFDDEEDPEEIKHVDAMANDLTPKSDVFALGIIFSEFFYGKRPFITTDGVKYIHEAVLDGGVSLSDSIPEKLRILIFDMLNKDFNKRPSISEVGKRIKSLTISKTKISKPTITFVNKADDDYLTTLYADSDFPIYYTIDGSDPTITSKKYEEPFTVKKFTLIKAACINGKYASDTESKTAWVKTNVIRTVSRRPRIIVKNRLIRIIKDEKSPESTIIYYTTDETTPSTSSSKYSAEFTVDNKVSIIRAIAVEPGVGKLASEVAEAKVYRSKIQKPEIHYKSGEVTLGNAEEMPIYYTLDGSDPNKSSIRYSSPFMLTNINKFIVKAIVISEDGDKSEISCIQRPNPNILKK